MATTTPAFAGTTAGGTLLGFGRNNDGQVTTGTANQTTPVMALLPAGTVVTGAAAGYQHTLALTSTGLVYAWGNNADGALGNGTTTASTAPGLVNLPSGTVVTAVSAGDEDSLALTSTGQVYAWGLNSVGQVGKPNSGGTVSTPVLVSLPAGTVATAISAGYDHGLALTSTGKVYAWGDNASGQLGNGTTTTSSTPVLVSLPSGVTATGVSAGYKYSLALTSAGSILGWGLNTTGQLGNGTTTSTTTPVGVLLPSGTTATGMAAGGLVSLALTSSGGVFAWGSDTHGEIGNGTTSTTLVTTPTVASLPSGATATAVAAGYDHALALTSGGQVLAWGYNAYGQLGNGTTTNASSPVSVMLPTGTGASAIAAGSYTYQSFVIVPPASTTTTVGSSPNPSSAGQVVTLTATVSPTDGGGTMAFSADDSPISECNAVPLTQIGKNYQATCTVSTLAEGNHAITASYSGDTYYTPSSGILNGGQKVLYATALAAAPVSIVSSILGLKVTYSARLTRVSDGSPIADQTVSFAPNTALLTSLGTCSATTNAQGVATCSSASVLGVLPVLLALGYTASFGGDAADSATTTTAAVTI